MNTQPQPKYNILLLGDHCLDIYKYGVVERLSPEAPVPIFKICRIEKKPGMAGNVKMNLENLGCKVQYFYDKTSTKTRLIDEKSMQHIVRIDDDAPSFPIVYNPDALGKYDAIVISDYNKGFIDYDTIKFLRQNFQGPIFVDTKKQDLAQFEGCIVKINESEYKSAKSFCSELIVTCGEKGAIYKNDRYYANAVDVADVCGAGDTFLAALAYKFLGTRNIPESITFAIAASALTVQHVGVYAPKLEEICV